MKPGGELARMYAPGGVALREQCFDEEEIEGGRMAKSYEIPFVIILPAKSADIAMGRCMGAGYCPCSKAVSSAGNQDSP
ncbi:MAG: hypothetical protein D6681_06595 [Calditrichaeota bacterium]|nr:MAG: hypothetical protein D6681_06595 [Calditrichota bacterium]